VRIDKGRNAGQADTEGIEAGTLGASDACEGALQALLSSGMPSDEAVTALLNVSEPLPLLGAILDQVWRDPFPSMAGAARCVWAHFDRHPRSKAPVLALLETKGVHPLSLALAMARADNRSTGDLRLDGRVLATLIKRFGLEAYASCCHTNSASHLNFEGARNGRRGTPLPPDGLVFDGYVSIYGFQDLPAFGPHMRLTRVHVNEVGLFRGFAAGFQMVGSARSGETSVDLQNCGGIRALGAIRADSVELKGCPDLVSIAGLRPKHLVVVDCPRLATLDPAALSGGDLHLRLNGQAPPPLRGVRELNLAWEGEIPKGWCPDLEVEAGGEVKLSGLRGGNGVLDLAGIRGSGSGRDYAVSIQGEGVQRVLVGAEMGRLTLHGCPALWEIGEGGSVASLYVGGNFNDHFDNFRSLPPDLEVLGDLTLWHCQAWDGRLPMGVRVGGRVRTEKHEMGLSPAQWRTTYPDGFPLAGG
jgi:hypothetical protein